MLQALGNRRLIDAIPLRKGSLRPFASLPQCQGFGPVGITDFPVRVAFASWCSVSMYAQSATIPTCQKFRVGHIPLRPLLTQILHVLSLCAFPYVPEAYAGGTITGVQGLKAFGRPVPMMQEKAGKMRTIMQQLAIFAHLKLPIAIMVQAALPRPTAVRAGEAMLTDLDLAPKSFCQCLRPTNGGHGKCLALPTTVLCLFEARRSNLKWLAARLVGTRQRCVFDTSMATGQLRARMRAIPHATFRFGRKGLKRLTARGIGAYQRDASYPPCCGSQVATGDRAVLHASFDRRGKGDKGLATGFPSTDESHTVHRLNHQGASYQVERCALGPHVDRHTRLTDHPHRDRLGGCAAPPNPMSIAYMLLNLKE